MTNSADNTQTATVYSLSGGGTLSGSIGAGVEPRKKTSVLSSWSGLFGFNGDNEINSLIVDRLVSVGKRKPCTVKVYPIRLSTCRRTGRTYVEDRGSFPTERRTTPYSQKYPQRCWFVPNWSNERPFEEVPQFVHFVDYTKWPKTNYLWRASAREVSVMWVGVTVEVCWEIIYFGRRYRPSSVRFPLILISPL